jgi:hypothetical protein
MSVQKIELPFDVDLVPVRELRAGNLTCLYEAGNLRYIRWGEEEVVRMLYTAVRDENWATATVEINDENIEEKCRWFYHSLHGRVPVKCYPLQVRHRDKRREEQHQFCYAGRGIERFSTQPHRYLCASSN